MPEARSPIVNSHNEWDPLEEVIVGSLDGAVNTPWEAALQAVTPKEDVERTRAFALEHGGESIVPAIHAPAQKELNEFVRALRGEGVIVRQPDPFDHRPSVSTPDWTIEAGNCHASPRDVLIVIGNEILEAPMAWRSRYFEFLAYRSLVMEYWKKGRQVVRRAKATDVGPAIRKQLRTGQELRHQRGRTGLGRRGHDALWA